MATATKPYTSVLEKYYTETATKWRPATEEELSALRAAALDPDNGVKMSRFKQPPTVAQVVAALKKLPQDAKVLVSGHDGNGLAALLDVSDAHSVSVYRNDKPEDMASNTVVVVLYPR